VPDTHSPLFGLSLRSAPANVEAEAALLGGLLYKNETFAHISSFLRPHHFADGQNGRAYAAIEAFISEGRSVDAVLLKQHFDQPYLASLLAAMIAPNLVREYAAAVVDTWLRRQLAAVGEQMINNAHAADLELTGQAQLNAAHELLAELLHSPSPDQANSMSIGEAIHLVEHHASMIYKGVAPPALSTGLPSLDGVLGGGIEPATFTVMGGLQESGKTELLLQIAEHVAMQQLDKWRDNRTGPCPVVLFFEFEMTAKQLAARTAARIGRMPRADIRHGRMTDQVTAGFLRATEIGDVLPIKIEALSPATLGRFRSAFRSLMRQREVAMVAVDNITLMADATGVKDTGQAYSTVLNELNNAAKTTGVPIIALAHILKSSSTRDDGRPKSDDLPYNTGRYPDKAVIVHRPEKHLSAAPPERNGMSEERWLARVEDWHQRKAAARNVTEVIPAKSREDDGARRPEMFRLTYDREASRFVDPSERIEPDMDWDAAHA
jgi:replicative DNA helicase